jgi:uncharacterized protein (DUF2267 family)
MSPSAPWVGSDAKEVRMKYEEFLREVKERTGITDRAEAKRTVVTVLQALCDRLTADEAEDLLAQLPEPLKQAVTVTGEAPVKMTAREFVGRVAEELQVPPEDAQQRIRAVFAVLRAAVTPGEFHDVLVQLPSGYFELLTA